MTEPHAIAVRKFTEWAGDGSAFVEWASSDVSVIGQRLWNSSYAKSNLKGLPDGAKVDFIKDFGDTAALMLTVSSPRASEIEVQIRAEKVAAAARRVLYLD